MHVNFANYTNLEWKYIPRTYSLFAQKTSESIVNMCLTLCIYLNIDFMALEISTSLQKDWHFPVFFFKPLRTNITVALTHNLETHRAITLSQQIITYYTCVTCL